MKALWMGAATVVLLAGCAAGPYDYTYGGAYYGAPAYSYGYDYGYGPGYYSYGPGYYYDYGPGYYYGAPVVSGGIVIGGDHGHYHYRHEGHSGEHWNGGHVAHGNWHGSHPAYAGSGHGRFHATRSVAPATRQSAAGPRPGQRVVDVGSLRHQASASHAAPRASRPEQHASAQ